MKNSNTNKKENTCKICNSTFSSKYSLNSHLVLIHKENPYECKKCSKTFYKKNQLIAHIRLKHIGLSYNELNYLSGVTVNEFNNSENNS